MNVLDDIYCGITHDIPSEKECRKALRSISNSGWKVERFGFGGKSNSDDMFQEEYDEEAEEMVRNLHGVDLWK